LNSQKTLIKEDFAFIQLPYYYSENIKVGNKYLSYSLGTIHQRLLSNREKIYEVRFFVYRDTKDVNPLHRIVQTCFVSESKLNSLFIDLP
jgi:hypothetical protein